VFIRVIQSHIDHNLLLVHCYYYVWALPLAHSHGSLSSTWRQTIVNKSSLFGAQGDCRLE